MSIKIEIINGPLTQWDVNRQMLVDGAPEGFRAHFWNDCTDLALVVPPNPGSVICNVPNILLQRAMPISVAIFAQGAGDGAEGKTEAAACFRVAEKLKPQDYDYTENIGYIDWIAKAQEVQAIMDDLRSRAESGEFNGQDGYSPTITAYPVEGGHRVTVTDRNGTKSFDVLDGQGSAVDLDPALNDPTKAAQAKAAGDGIRKAQKTADGKQDKIKPEGITPGQLIRVKAVSDDGSISEWDAVDMPSIPADVATTGYVDGKIRDAIGSIDAALSTLADRAEEVAL